MKFKLSIKVKDEIAGLTFVSPVMIGIFVFNAIPICMSIFFSFTNYDNINPAEWIGIKNFIDLFKDEWVRNSFYRTFEYTLWSVPWNMFFGFFSALCMNSNVKAMATYRVLFYLPCIVPGICSAMIWKDMFNPTMNGGFNRVFEALGLIEEPLTWFSHPDTVVFTMIFMSLFSFGGGCLLWLATFKGIPTSLYESAALDGAKWYHRLFKITIPMCTPLIFYNLVTGIIGALQASATAMLLTGGGPVGKTHYIAYNIYVTGLVQMDMGYACAQAWILTLIIMAFTLVLFKSGGWVYYGEDQ